MSDELRKEKLRFWLKIAVFFILLLGLVIVIRCINKNRQFEQEEAPPVTEIDKTIQRVINEDYDINDIDIKGNYEADKETLIYELDRLIRHLESVYMSKATSSDKKKVLERVLSHQEYPFCQSKPNIFLVLEDSSNQFISFDEVVDIVISPIPKKYFIVRLDMDSEQKADCIQALYLYVKEYDEK